MQLSTDLQPWVSSTEKWMIIPGLDRSELNFCIQCFAGTWLNHSRDEFTQEKSWPSYICSMSKVLVKIATQHMSCDEH